MTTKKDFKDEFDLALNTVRTTLKSCGLETEKQDYSEEEANKFREARRMKDAGLSYSEISKHFGVEQEEAAAAAATTSSGTTSSSSSNILDVVEQQFTEQIDKLFDEMSERMILKGAENLPRFLVSASVRLNNSGELAAAFHKGMENYESGDF